MYTRLLQCLKAQAIWCMIPTPLGGGRPPPLPCTICCTKNVQDREGGPLPPPVPSPLPFLYIFLTSKCKKMRSRILLRTKNMLRQCTENVLYIRSPTPLCTFLRGWGYKGHTKIVDPCKRVQIHRLPPQLFR